MRAKKNLRSIGMICLVMIIFLNSIPFLNVKAENAKENRVVRVACGMNDTLYLDESGAPAGICLPYLRQLAWNSGWTLEYVEGSYTEGIQNLYDGKVDLMFPVGKDDDVEGKLAFADFIGGYQQIGLFAKEDADIYYDDYEGFSKKKVGLSLGANSNILDAFAKEHQFTYTPVSLNTIQDKIDALMDGSVDLIAFSTLNTVPGGKLVAVLDQVPFYFAVSKDNQELLKELNSAMSEAMVNTPDLVSGMYQDVLKGYNKISYTKEEHEKIKSTEEITVGVYKDRAPLAYTKANGESAGIYVDLLKELGEESGLHIKIKAVEDDKKLYKSLDAGKVDFVIGILELRFSSENESNHLASNALADFTTVAVTKPEYRFEGEEHPNIVLTAERTYLKDYILEKFPGAKITYRDTRKECLDAIEDGTQDATFLNTWEYNYEAKNPRYQDMMEWESIRIKSNVALGATKQSDMEILSILEKAISRIPQTTVSDIISRNLDMPYSSFNIKDRFYEIKNELLIFGAILFVLFVCAGIYLKVRKRYIKDLIIANNTKSDFLSRMSHELRTPLNAINGYAALTVQNTKEEELQPEKIAENMDSIQKASEYLLGIIKDILDVQKMDTGKITLEKSEINPNEYMNTVVKMIQPMADEKQVKFTYTMINGGTDNYLLDPLRLQQILFNILYNAVKFTPKGGNVTMTSDIMEKDATHVTIRFIVSDTGIGMSREFVKTKLFQRFAQENQDITSPYAGCGNGLAICKELVDLMDGKVTCESEQGKGTTFTILIRTEYCAQKKRRRVKKEMPNYDLSGIHVLMCEDNPMNQDMEMRILKRMKCEVDIADDGQIGLERFKQSEEGFYDILLMDIRMPNMDGLATTRAIRMLDRKDAKEVPILAVSANAFEEDVKKSLDAGMNEHLAKPVDVKILYEKITAYCKKKR